MHWSWNTFTLSSFSKGFSGPKWFFLAFTTIKLKKNNQLLAHLWFSAEVCSTKSCPCSLLTTFPLGRGLSTAVSFSAQLQQLQQNTFLSYLCPPKCHYLTCSATDLLFALNFLFYWMAFSCYFSLGLPTFAGYKNASKSCAPETYTSPMTPRLFPLKFDRELWTTL